MMASPEADAFHQMVRQFRDATIGDMAAGVTPSIEMMRAGAEASMAVVGVMPDGVTVTERTLAGRRTLQLDPVGATTDHVLLYFHGGGYVMNTVDTHQKLAAGLAKATGCRTLVFDYRMGPEDPFPANHPHRFGGRTTKNLA